MKNFIICINTSGTPENKRYFVGFSPSLFLTSKMSEATVFDSFTQINAILPKIYTYFDQNRVTLKTFRSHYGVKPDIGYDDE